jgi:excinuclease ABC subunit C
MLEPLPERAAGGPRGAQLIRELLPTLPNEPGVYRMLDARGEPLYVGKARSLRKRVAAYTRSELLSARLQRMVALTRSMEFVTTASEVEALLLEANMIKRLRPSFNIVLRDDKSFPYIAIDGRHSFPQIRKHRGPKRKGVDYFGPFASAGAVNETLSALRRAFPLRSCKDSIFAARTRPCLEYQIKRCTAPCVGRIDTEAYAGLVAEVKSFLSGRSREVQERLSAEMRGAAEGLDFERAAALRDRIKALAHITAQQGINTDAVADADVVGIAAEAGQACVQVFFYRGGRNYGNRAHYPAHVRDSAPGDVLAAFLAQFYAERPAARLVLLDRDIAERELLAEALGVSAGHKVEIAVPQRGERRRLVEIAVANARQALARRLAEGDTQRRQLDQLGSLLGLDRTPSRIEVYDNSHIQGRYPVGVCVAAGLDGLDKAGYRAFAIRDTSIAPGDDFAMMREVFSRRFGRLQKEDPDRSSGAWPDIVMIDGGAGQLGAARAALEAVGVTALPLVAVAKGPDRDAGRERLFVEGREPITLDPRDPLLYFVQRLRDEAHRFAITRHRGQRGKAIGRSALDHVPGIGPARKRALLNHFGSVKGIEQAGLADLERVAGINKAVAKAIYAYFHEGG